MAKPACRGASIIIPTYREAANVKNLTERLFAAMGPTGRPVELILVDDDSRDGIDKVVEELSRDHPVRLIVRTGERGLSTAVIAGFREAKFDRLVVLDADLQHPPETVPALLDRLDARNCDFVIASRFVEGASIAEDWPRIRRLASLIARWLAYPIAPLTDPMSGFFALHRSTWERAEPPGKPTCAEPQASSSTEPQAAACAEPARAEALGSALNPIGYKIALELYVKGRCRQPGEVPLQFAARAAGESKFGFTEQIRYLRHLTRLYRFRFPWLGWVIWVLALGVAASVALVGLRSSG